jgi:hypothetical protein
MLGVFGVVPMGPRLVADRYLCLDSLNGKAEVMMVPNGTETGGAQSRSLASLLQNS